MSEHSGSRIFEYLYVHLFAISLRIGATRRPYLLNTGVFNDRQRHHDQHPADVATAAARPSKWNHGDGEF